MGTRSTVIALALAAIACSKHEDAQHPTAPMRLDTPGPVAQLPAKPGPAVRVPIAWDRDLAFLPVDSELVVGIDLVQLHGSALWKEYSPSLLAKAHDQLAAFQARCGFDPLETIAGVSFGMKGLGTGTPRGAAVLHGLSRPQVKSCMAQAPGATADGDAMLIHSPDGDLAATFVDDATLLVVMGQGTTKAELDAAKAGTSALPTSVVFSEMFKLVDKRGSAWLLMNGNSPALAPVKTIASDLRALIGSIALTDHLAIDGRLRMGTTQTAATLVQILNGQVASAKSLFDRLDVTADNADVHVELAMSADQLEQIAAMLQTPLVHRDAKGH